MEIVITIIMVMVGFSFVLKLTCHGWPGRIVNGLVAAIFILSTYGAAASQSKTRIAEWLNQPELMLDTSVWLTVDVAFQICFCVLAAKSLYVSLTRTERVLLHLTLWVPGLLIFPTLFSLLTELIFTLTGVDFTSIALGLAIVLLAGVPALAALVKYLIPEVDIRLEMMFMVNLIIAALGIVATVNGRTAAAGTSEVEWTVMAAVALLLVLGAAAGIVINRYLNNKRISKLQ